MALIREFYENGTEKNELLKMRNVTEIKIS